ncbi:unnamed protein product, partial [Rhizoctonia solani]
KFLECSKIATSKQQNSCYLRAADCFAQAEEWKPAAETFILARDFGMAAKCFRNAGCFGEAVEIVQRHSEHIQENVAEAIKKVARLEYLRTAQYEQAEELFDDLDKQLDCMEDYGLESGRIQVLEQHQRHEEAVEAAADAAFSEGNIIKGICILKSSNDPTLLRRAAERALEGLWTLFPIGKGLDFVDNAAAYELIHYLLDEPGLLTEEEVEQLEVFRAIHSGDLARIEFLAQSHGKLGSDSFHNLVLSLLCFPRISSTLIPSGDWLIHDFINSAKLAWKYFAPLFLFARNLNILESSTQKLLGIEPAEHRSSSVESKEDGIVSPGFRIYSTSPLYNFVLQLDTSRRGLSTPNHTLQVASLTATESDTRELAAKALNFILRTEIFKVHEAATSFNFQVIYPCLEFGVFGNCKRLDCHRQHVSSLRASETDRRISFNLRTRALIMQIHLMDKYYAQSRQDETERRKIRRTWVHKMYETLMPLFPSLGGLHCVDAAMIPELDKGAYLISVWCQQALFELDPYYGAADWFLSNALALLDLAFRVEGKGFAKYVSSLHSSRLVKPRPDLMANYSTFYFNWPPYSILHDFVNFYRRKSDDAIWRVIQATQQVVLGGLNIEANLLVHLLEFVGREVIVQNRLWSRGTYGVFDDLLVPQSWALELVKRAPLHIQNGTGMMEFLGILYKTMQNLREHNVKPSPFYSFGGRGGLNVVARGILILRICRLIVLVSNNVYFTPPMKETARLNIIHALTGPGELHHSLCDRLVLNRSWIDLEDVVMRCPLNRGPDRLVRLLLWRTTNYPQPRPNSFIRVITYKKVPDLIQLLSLTSSAPRPQPKPNTDPEKDTEPEGDTTGLMQSNHEASRFDALPEKYSKLTHTLTTKEIEMGRRILLAYRRYVRRKQAGPRLAVKTIWRCYSRYRARRDSPRSAANERYLEFQREYRTNIKLFENSKPTPNVYYRYKAILLGCMPHVAVHLCGLGHANQVQKDANRQRLQTAHHKDLEEIEARMEACR